MIKKYWKSLTIFWVIVLIFIGSIFLFFNLVSDGKLGFMPTFEELENPESSFSSEIYTADNVSIGKYFRGSENRLYIDYKNIPKSVEDALIATEDVRFYDHSGIDIRGLFRVAKGLLTGNAASSGGGSTITQQLAKMLFPRNENRYFIELAIQKFREWVIAVKLEKSYTKEEIITMYLNKFDFLNLAVGINSAANIYFGISPDSLRVEQSAMLVGMAKNPALYNPIRFPERALGRRNIVLGQMRKYGMLEQEVFDSLRMLPLGINFTKEDHKEGAATYLREYLRQYMTAKRPEKNSSVYRWNKQQYAIDSLAWESDPLYGWCSKNFKKDNSCYDIYSDGLKIYTTIDSRMQRYAEEAVTEHLGLNLQPEFDNEKSKKRNPPFSNDISKAMGDSIMSRAMESSERFKMMKAAGIEPAQIRAAFLKPVEMKVFTWKGIRDTVMTPMDSLKHYKAFLRAGFMVMEPQTGYIKAYVGGPNYSYFMYDMVSVGRRQVGSTIKPILYTLAMQEGMNPCDRVLNVPQTFFTPGQSPWTPRNSSKKHEGEMVTLKWGLANSVNNISAWLMRQFTPEALVHMAHNMGIMSYIDPVPAAILGTSEITVKEMVAAFAIFSNKGVYNRPMMVTRIEDKYGNELASFIPDSRDVITENSAYLMANLLQEVINKGTGMRLRFTYKITAPTGGKTGTTQNHSDGWFMAITPNLAGGVWVGAEDRSIHFQSMRSGQGANMALPIWGLFIQKVYADKSIGLYDGPFERPPGFNIDLDCGEEGDNPDDTYEEILEGVYVEE